MTQNALSKTYIFFAIFLTTGCMFAGGEDGGGSNNSNGDALGYGASTGSTTFDDDDEPGESTGEPADNTARDETSTGSPPSSDEDPGSYAMFESFTIDVNQTITMGSFVMPIGQVEVIGSPDTHQAPTVRFAVNPENQDEEPQIPFYAADRQEDLLLTINGKHFFGFVYNLDQIPGYLMGESGLLWYIDDADLTPDDIRSGVITLGPAESNQVVIPLSAPEETVDLNDVPLATLTLENVDGDKNFVFDDVHIQFSQKSTNTLLPRDTAWLMLGGTVSASSFDCLSTSDLSITAPNGPSRVAHREYWPCIYAGEVEAGYVLFEIDAPYAGTYEVRFFDTTFEVVVPEFDL